MSNWDILQRELLVNGIEVIDNTKCRCASDGESKVLSLSSKVANIEKEILSNADLFKDTLLNLENYLSENKIEPFIVDIRLRRLFIDSLKGIHELISFLKKCSPFFEENIFLKHKDLEEKIEQSLLKDINYFSKDCIYAIPDIRLVLDWMFRRNAHLVYVARLLRFAMSGQDQVNSVQIKTARSIQGPWAHLDLPMRERVWEWGDIEEEIRGRRKDIRQQRRYWQGLKNYNNDGRVGEGYFWREIRNEPYSWYDRTWESPYPHRSVLSNY